MIHLFFNFIMRYDDEEKKGFFFLKKNLPAKVLCMINVGENELLPSRV